MKLKHRLMFFFLGIGVLYGGLFLVSLFDNIFVRSLMIIFPLGGVVIMLIGGISNKEKDAEDNSQEKEE